MIPNFIRKSLRLKLILASVLVELIMLSLLLGNSIRIIDNTIAQESLARTEAASLLLDSALSIPLFERDSATLNELLVKLIQSSNSDFTYIKVYDEHGRIYAQIKNPIWNSINSKKQSASISQVSSDIKVSGEIIGSFDYGLSIKALTESRESLFQQGLLIALIEIIFTTILLGTIGYLLTRHVGTLLQAVQQVSSGSYDAKVPVKTKDEIGLLADGFNQMSKSIQHRIVEITETSQALATKTAEFESVFNSITDGIVFLDPNGTCISVNPAMLNLFGYSQDKLIGNKLNFLYANADDFESREKLNDGIDLPDANESYELMLQRFDGACFTGEVSESKVRDNEGNHIGFIAILRDISVRKQFEQDLMEAKEKAQVTLSSIGDAVITTDEKGLVQYLNPVAEDLTGWKTLESINRPLPEVFNIRNEITKNPVENPVERCLRENIIVGLANHTELVSRDGKIFAIEDSAAPIRDNQGEILGVILVFHDVSKARSLTNQISWHASHDTLTGLINRYEFEIRLDKILEDTSTEAQHAIFYIDLDQFKVVNDTSGHIAGDELLKQLSQLFQRHIRDRDTLARLGGDEFGVLLENCPADQARKIAEEIISDLKGFRFLWKDQIFVTGASIGMVPFKNDNNESISSLMSSADLACYAAKDAGRNRVHVYQLDDKQLVQRHGEMQWVAKIQAALENNLFELYCQPIVSPTKQTKSADHYEILIRMRDEDDQLILPLTFLPAAERYNLMPDIDRWVITNVIAQLNQFSPKIDSMIAINLSGKSLSDENFLDFVIRIFDEELIPAEQICFEITETAAITNLSRVTRFIAALQKHGCQFSLDDFGSGLSSFQYLKNLNVNFLKIDGAFVQDMAEDRVDRSMVESINQIGHVMSIKTIAEYVETQQTQDMLTEIGVDYLQGFHISKPFPFKDLAKFETPV